MKPYWSDDLVTLHLGDCLDVLRTMEADSIDAIVTDPPAGIAFMDREWDDFRRARNPADTGRDNVFGRTSARGPEYGRRDRRAFVDMLTARLAEAYRVLKPGGHALVWAIPRTSHWTAWAIEDAGFDLRDCVLHLFGSGFPKSLDVGKAIDRTAGRQGVSVRALKLRLRELFAASGKTLAQIDAECGFRAANYLTLDAEGKRPDPWINVLPSLEKWQQIKRVIGIAADPALDAELDQFFTAAEREVIAQRHAADRRGDGTVIGLGHTGNADITAPATDAAARWDGWGTALKPGQEMWWLARKPLGGRTVAANVLEFGTGALNVDGCKVAHASAADLATSLSKNPGRADKVTSGTYGADRPQQSVDPAGRWPTNLVLTHSASCDGACAPDCPAGELDRQSGVTVSRIGQPRRSAAPGEGYGMVHTGTEYADTGGASRFYPVFRYQAKAPTSERPRLEDGTAHETVKPLGLMSWLVRLITPPGGTVLDMFAGSGPTAEACIIEGFRCVLIEQDPKSAALIRKRLSKPIQPVMFGFDEAG